MSTQTQQPAVEPVGITLQRVIDDLHAEAWANAPVGFADPNEISRDDRVKAEALKEYADRLRDHPARIYSTSNPKIVCLCGSMRFEDEIREAAREESIAGHIVVLPLVNMKQPHRLWNDPDAAEAIKTGLDDLHKRKIDLADEVLVVCPMTDDMPFGYIGDSTRSEIAYATARGKPVRYRIERTAKRVVAVPVEGEL